MKVLAVPHQNIIAVVIKKYGICSKNLGRINNIGNNINNRKKNMTSIIIL